MTDQHKLNKFIQRIESFILELQEKNTLLVHSKINQFFYMQKLEELKVLVASIKDGVKRLEILEESMESSQKEIFFAWRRDARWLNKHKTQEKMTASELPSN